MMSKLRKLIRVLLPIGLAGALLLLIAAWVVYRPARLTLTHLSGGSSAWVRTNYLFLRILRKHFLDWRVVPESEKLGFLQRARLQLGAPAELVQEAQIAIDEALATAALVEERSADPRRPHTPEASHGE